MSGADPAAAGDWWDGLDPGRRAQIHQWISSREHQPTAVAGQLELLDEIDRTRS